MKNLIMVVLVVLLAACSAEKSTSTANEESGRKGQKKEQRGQAPSVDELLAKMDTNKDGKLAKSEVKGPLLNDFAKIDTDNDGFISRAELEKAPKPQRGNKERPARQ